MLDALYISGIGLQAQKQQLDAVANNFANIGTTAFKRGSVDFSAMLDRSPEASSTDVVRSGSARNDRVLRYDLTAGPVQATGRPLDIAVGGSGFVEVELPDGKVGYTRAGALQINADGGLSTSSGLPLKADVRVPGGAIDTHVMPDGSVMTTVPGAKAAKLVGQIELAVFTNPEVLQYRGDGVFVAPEGVADPVHARAGEEGTEPFVVRSLESSNVDLTSEMVQLVLVQRAFELNSRIAQVADELMGMTNNLRRG